MANPGIVFVELEVQTISNAKLSLDQKWTNFEEFAMSNKEVGI